MQEQGVRKERIGVVVSNKMDKTITVSVGRTRQHALYKKAIKRTSKFKAHDAENTCQIGDLVRIQETRPQSKTKCWRLLEIIKRAE